MASAGGTSKSNDAEAKPGEVELVLAGDLADPMPPRDPEPVVAPGEDSPGILDDSNTVASKHPLKDALIAECMGTFILVFFGVGSVTSAVALGALQGLFQVAAVWWFGVTLGILASERVSGAHLNPAISFALALFRPEDFKWRHFLPYCAAQFTGAILAGVCNLFLFWTAIENFENEIGVTRGEDGSERSAMMFGEYFPNPDIKAAALTRHLEVSPVHALGIEAFGTAILAFIVFTMTHEHRDYKTPGMIPLIIGLTVASIISVTAPMTQAGLNPARDWGPRLVAACAGWGRIAIPGPRNGFWVYGVGPMIGAPFGAFCAKAIGSAMHRKGTSERKAPEHTV